MTGSGRDEARTRSAARRIESRLDPADEIRFGTSGWRGTLGEEITFPRLRRLIRGVADWIREEERGDRVLIGWDGRFASRLMAERAAHVLAKEGLTPVLASRLTPTPALTHALRKQTAAAGLVLTASHNPAPDHGLKVFGPSGAAVTDVEAARIESATAKRRAEDRKIPHSVPVLRVDFTADYQSALASILSPDVIRRSGIRVVYDAMHGAGGGILDGVLAAAGAVVTSLRAEADPYFGGGLPDPQAERLRALCETVAAISAEHSGLVVGLATDGDGDRLGVVDGTGRVLTETQTIALLVDHLAASGRIGKGVAVTEGTGSLVTQVAARHGLRVDRYPVGFKYLSAAMAAGNVDAAGEESGGFALAEMGLDKDGLLAGSLLVELVASTGESIEARLADLEAEFGVSACGRTATPLSPAKSLALERLAQDPPAAVGGTAVVSVSVRRGLRLGLADGGFLIFRRSGTEPVVRVYAEAADPDALSARLAFGLALLESTKELPEA